MDYSDTLHRIHNVYHAMAVTKLSDQEEGYGAVWNVIMIRVKAVLQMQLLFHHHQSSLIRLSL